jgi:hypothetical protein
MSVTRLTAATLSITTSGKIRAHAYSLEGILNPTGTP